MAHYTATIYHCCTRSIYRIRYNCSFCSSFVVSVTVAFNTVRSVARRFPPLICNLLRLCGQSDVFLFASRHFLTLFVSWTTSRHVWSCVWCKLFGSPGVPASCILKLRWLGHLSRSAYWKTSVLLHILYSILISIVYFTAARTSPLMCVSIGV